MKREIAIGIAAALFAASGAWAKIGGGDIIFDVKGADKVVFTHDSHAGKTGLRCKECHYAIFTTVEKHANATMADIQRGQSCGACHNGGRAFDVKGNCGRCHKK